MPSGGGSKTQTVTSDIPAQYKDFANENLSIAGTIANMPNVQYQGPRIASFSPMQNQAMSFVEGADFGTDAMGRLQNYQAQTGAQNMDAYFNPYENQVVQGMQGDAQKALANGLNMLGARAAGGNFGSRLGVSEGIATSEAADNLARNTANLRHQGFTTAAGLGMADADRDLSGANLQLNAANSLAAAQQAKANAMLGIGNMQQSMDQANLDLAYGDFLEQQNDPLRKLSIRMGALGQTPMGSVQRVPVQSSGGLGSFLGGLGSLGLGLGGMGVKF